MAKKRGNRSILDRAFFYDAKLDPVRVGGVVDAQKTRMLENFATTTEDMYTVEKNTQSLCGTLGEPVTLSPFYLGFSKQLWALKRRGYGGTTLTDEAQGKKDKWEARGLTDATLIAIGALHGITLV
jgi:hypothetical protein